LSHTLLFLNGRWLALAVPHARAPADCPLVSCHLGTCHNPRVEAPVLTGRLRALLEHLGITTAPQYRIKEVPRSGRVEFKTITEIFFGSRVLCRHKGPAFRTSRSDAVADATWQAITLWVRSNKSRLQNSVHYLLPYRKKDQFKAYGVKKDIPRMEMVHHQDVTVELSTHLLAAQREIETLRIQL
jgi:hypothetical protein